MSHDTPRLRDEGAGRRRLTKVEVEESASKVAQATHDGIDPAQILFAIQAFHPLDRTLVSKRAEVLLRDQFYEHLKRQVIKGRHQLD